MELNLAYIKPNQLHDKQNFVHSENTLQTYKLQRPISDPGHSYADDTQVYISAPVTETQPTSACLAECIKHLDRWMSQNGLKLNAEKTQLVWLGTTRQQLTKLTISQLALSSSTVDLVSTVTILGVVLDGQLTTAPHAASICRSGFFQLCQLKSIR